MSIPNLRKWLNFANESRIRIIVGRRKQKLRKGTVTGNVRARRPSSMPTYTELDKMVSRAVYHGQKECLNILQNYRTSIQKKHRWESVLLELQSLSFSGFVYKRGSIE